MSRKRFIFLLLALSPLSNVHAKRCFDHLKQNPNREVPASEFTILASQIARSISFPDKRPESEQDSPDLIAHWPVITARPHEKVLGFLKDMNAELEADAKPDWKFDLDGIVDNTKSLLSLGEGVSNFIQETRAKQTKKGIDANNVHAADATTPEIVPSYYHKSYFTHLDLIDTQGNRAKFDEIVASYSLGYVASPVFIYQKRNLSNAVLNLLVPLDHLNPGGFLRIIAIHDKDMVAYNEIFKELRNRGIISEYKFLKTEGNSVVIKK